MALNNLPEMPAGPVLELYGQRKRCTVPVGLKCLLEELSREVLRNQPPNIYEFLASYLKEKLQKLCEWEHQERKSWEWRRWSWEGSSQLTNDELMEFLELHHLTFSEANKIAVIIQSVYRGYRDRQMVKGLRRSLEKEDLVDIEYDGEDTYWTYDGNGQIIKFTADDVEKILTNYNLTQEEANKYAIKIQKTFRGYRTRESFAKDFPELAARMQAIEMKQLELKVAKLSTTSGANNRQEHETKIQSLYRGYKARKEAADRLKTIHSNEFPGEEEFSGEGKYANEQLEYPYYEE